ncbi:histidine phosphatase family protein [Sneathiella sp.]|uniref:histidine phosphatase family protein n=1 Tax=Sneathiella sp. TaxID=1964365 RepID=UPI003562653C
MVLEYSKRNWWLIRHAPVLSPTICGQSDLAADMSDRARLQALASLLPDGAEVFSSDLLRCRETAREIFSHRDGHADTPTLLASLREQDFGDWEGRSHADVEREDPAGYRAFWENPAENRPAGGESFSQLVARVHPQIDALWQAATADNIIIVAHAGTIRAIVGLALGLTVDKMLALSVAPLSLTSLSSYRKGDDAGSWQVNYINDQGAALHR